MFIPTPQLQMSFTLLHGTNLSKPGVCVSRDRLIKKLMETTAAYKFTKPAEIGSQRENSYFEGWKYEILSPIQPLENLFFLVVISPNCPGCSPINPFHKIDNHPMFAINMCKDYYVVWQEGDSMPSIERKFINCKNEDDIYSAFESFLTKIICLQDIHLLNVNP